MFYCDPCKDKREWPDSFLKSRGKCECCGEVATCNDVPSSLLPYPKTMSAEEIAAAERVIAEVEAMPRRFYLGDNEVTKEEYVRAERAAGFRNTMGKPNEPATGAFGSGDLRGHVEYVS